MNQWLTLGIASLLTLLQRELYNLLPRLSNWLISRVGEKLPVEIRSRYVEEWLAESEEYAGSLAQVVHAASLTFCGTAGRLTRDHYEGRLFELDDSLRVLLVTWDGIERQLITFRENLLVERPRQLGVLKQRSNEAVEKCYASADSARESANYLLADKVQEVAGCISALSMTIEQALTTLARNTDLEIEFLMGVTLECRQSVLYAAHRVNGALRFARRRRADWDALGEVVGDIASQVHKFRHVNSIPNDPAREARNAHSARIQAAVLELARPENGRPSLSLTQQPQS